MIVVYEKVIIFDIHRFIIILDNGPYWISYDDEQSVALKTKYANFLGLAGSFGWSLETDDFDGLYHDQPYPLLRVNSTSLLLN